MENIVEVQYHQTGQSAAVDTLGMREIQTRVYQARSSQYLLIKAPPASGKSRALMFTALDKLMRQGLRKAVIAVPNRPIGASFKATELKKSGFFFDWEPDLDLTKTDEDVSAGKIKTLAEFLEGDEGKIAVCTHAALCALFKQVDPSFFNEMFVAIDEFHHTSADRENNHLGALVHALLEHSTAHLAAMTGSYFRGDGCAVLLPEDEAKFAKVTYNYYDQLNGYQYLKSLGIGYHFYNGRWTDAIDKVLNTDQKTILYIPHIHSRESTGDKMEEVNRVLDSIGGIVETDPETQIIKVRRRSDGKIIKVADLVNDTPDERDRLVAYLRRMKSPDDLDLIIALGMAREGFDWPYCEHTLTVGYRGSLTEVVQIIGRCTRDCMNKTHAQFTNLLAEPDAERGEISDAVNEMLKAVTCSLLMEQVLAPRFEFKAKIPNAPQNADPNTVHILGFKEPSTPRSRKIIENDLDDLMASVLQDPNIRRAMACNTAPQTINKELIPKVIAETYPDLTDDEAEEVRQGLVAKMTVKNPVEQKDDRRLIQMAGQFVNLDDLTIDLIDSVDAFHNAFQIMSKNLDQKTLGAVRDYIEVTRSNMTGERAAELWPKIKEFKKTLGREPNSRSDDRTEAELGLALNYLQTEKRKLDAQKAAERRKNQEEEKRDGN